ncbi:class I SAM-dependent methyltransferase [Lentibacillus sp. N15]|uniref:class I SAM-dependent methyltransferase n=1 Tax=Lentibacillus songyuanensis TaxID=3136161 RepID=UPI0031BA1ACE
MGQFNWEKEVETQWDDRAAFWNKRSMNMWDNGSGDGYGSYKLRQSGFDVTGMDLSGEMIRRANEWTNDDQIHFLQGNVTNLPFTDQRFDGVMAINILEWTETPAIALNELQRVVMPNGLLFIGVLGPTAGPRANSFPRLYGKPAICNTMMPWEFQRLAMEHELEYVDGFGVWKQGVNEAHLHGLPLELKQALSFMWIFMLRRTGEE